MSLEKLKAFIGYNSNKEDDYDEYDGYDEEYDEIEPVAPAVTKEVSQAARPSRVASTRGNNMKVVVVEPKVFEDSTTIANHLQEMRPVLINFEGTDPHEAARIVDFVSGATFALDGKLEKVGKDMFLCAPITVSIDHNDRLGVTTGETSAPQFDWAQGKQG